MKNINDHLYSWEFNVEVFFSWVEQICGVEKSSDTYTLLKSHIKEVDHIQEWIIFFNGNLDSIPDATADYIERKMITSGTSKV